MYIYTHVSAYDILNRVVFMKITDLSSAKFIMYPISHLTDIMLYILSRITLKQERNEENV